MNVLMKTLLNPGDEVLTFAPYFGEYSAYVNELRWYFKRSGAEYRNFPAKPEKI